MKCVICGARVSGEKRLCDDCRMRLTSPDDTQAVHPASQSLKQLENSPSSSSDEQTVCNTAVAVEDTPTLSELDETSIIFNGGEEIERPVEDDVVDIAPNLDGLLTRKRVWLLCITSAIVVALSIVFYWQPWVRQYRPPAKILPIFIDEGDDILQIPSSTSLDFDNQLPRNP